MSQATIQASIVVEPAKRIERTDSTFTDGVCCGWLFYHDVHQGAVLTDQDIHTLIVECLTDARYSHLWNTGWAIGWVEALLSDRDVLSS